MAIFNSYVELPEGKVLEALSLSTIIITSFHRDSEKDPHNPLVVIITIVNSHH